MEICIKWNVCRVCLQEEGNTSNKGEKNESIADPQMRNLFADSKLCKQIFLCSGIRMKPGDALPDKICRQCLTQLSHALSFRSICRNSNDYLQSVLRKTKSAASLVKLDRTRREQSLHLMDDMVVEEMFDYHTEEDFFLGAEPDDAIGDGDRRKNQALVGKNVRKNKPEVLVDTNSASMEDFATDTSDAGNTLKKSETMVLLPGTKDSHLNIVCNEIIEEDHDVIDENYLDEIEEIQDTKLIPKITSVCSIEDGDFTGTDDELIDLMPRKMLKHYRKQDVVADMSAGDKINNKVKLGTSNELKSGKESIREFVQDSDEADDKIDENEYFYVINEIKREQRDPPTTDAHKTLDGNAGYEVVHIDEETYVDDGTDERNKFGDLDESHDLEYIIDNGQKNVQLLDVAETTTNTVPAANTAAAQTTPKRRKNLLTEDSKDISCDVCGNHFTNRSLLKYHMRTHRVERNYECELCYKKFNASCNLTAHMRVHTGEKPYECQYCGRRFRDRSTHIKHERVHTNEKPFECEICGKSFALSTTLRAHEKVHSNEKPYECLPCSKRFKLAHQLKAHYNTHQHKVLANSEERLHTC